MLISNLAQLEVGKIYFFTPFRPTFNESLEFYPITRRAFNRALTMRENEMKEIKSVVDKI
jgi:hypothetical protein